MEKVFSGYFPASTLHTTSWSPLLRTATTVSCPAGGVGAGSDAGSGGVRGLLMQGHVLPETQVSQHGKHSWTAAAGLRLALPRGAGTLPDGGSRGRVAAERQPSAPRPAPWAARHSPHSRCARQSGSRALLNSRRQARCTEVWVWCQPACSTLPPATRTLALPAGCDRRRISAPPRHLAAPPRLGSGHRRRGPLQTAPQRRS